jgi:hypothetical protein
VKGRTRPPLGFPGDTAGPRGFTVAVDEDAAQVTLRGRPTGAGGGAYLAPAPGVELIFDRAGGWLSGVTVAVDQVTDEAVAWIADVFGAATAATVRGAVPGGIRCLALRARRRTLRVLSRLAQLDAARITSPVPGSRLWAAEAADLAGQAGLPRPGWGLSPAAAPVTGPGSLGSTIPADVMRLVTDDGPRPWPEALLEASPKASLDLGVVPHGIFRPGLWPGTDLAVRAGAPLITVEAVLLPGATPAGLASCRARLVDADGRWVLATAEFHLCAPSRAAPRYRADAASRAWAELPVPRGLHGLRGPTRSGAVWAEVVGDERRPADGSGLRRIRRALRWADAALRAETRPNGLAPELTDEQWLRLAALAWDRCRADWTAAGDPGRAALAVTRGATRQARPFLAELVGDG